MIARAPAGTSPFDPPESKSASTVWREMQRSRKMTRARDPKQRENHEKSCFSLFFQGFVGQNPFQNLRKTRPIILNRSQPPSTIPNPLYIDFTSLIFFCKKKFIVWSNVAAFLIFSLFLELRRLWDHSQIVDLIFLIWMVSTRASESSKTPHSWQNNVPKRSTKYF